MRSKIPGELLDELKRAYPKTSHSDPLMEWPIPYSVEGPGVRNPDIYSRSRMSSQGRMVKRLASAYGVIVDNTEDGSSIATRLVVLAKSKRGVVDRHRIIEIEREESRLRERRKRLIRLFRGAISLYRKEGRGDD